VARVRGASRRAVEKLLSEYRPPAALRDRIRYVQVAQPAPRDVAAALWDRRSLRAVPEEWRDSPPTCEKVFVQFLADDEFLKVFEDVRALIPNGDDKDFADVMKAALVEYRDRHSPSARHARREAKKREESPDSHRREWNDTTQSRHIPDDVRDQVFVRDGNQCTFVGWNGTRCQCSKGLQVDHIVPFAVGGTHDPANLRLLCGAHNRLHAEQTLGKHVMQPFWRRQ
jgi:5-methylcytosine-specific restriction endonuclease McrA